MVFHKAVKLVFTTRDMQNTAPHTNLIFYFTIKQNKYTQKSMANAISYYSRFYLFTAYKFSDESRKREREKGGKEREAKGDGEVDKSISVVAKGG